MRSGQHNKRGRGRNRRHGGGGGGGGGNYNGNPGNRVLDSNGPDVKLRGTAQTIAEKYMQLGRDAQLAGDTVMSESYYQHGEHYYRLWLANQPAGQPIQFSRRPGEEEMEEDGAEGEAEGDDETAAAEGQAPESETPTEGAEASAPAEDGDAQQNSQQRNVRQRDNRDGRDGRDNRDQRDNRDGGNGRERFRNRWPRRGDRNQDGPRDDSDNSRQERAAAPAPEQETEQGNWETPSFLTRPAPVVQEEAGNAEPERERRPQREGRPRRERETSTPEE